jgi:hypothetical protein
VRDDVVDHGVQQVEVPEAGGQRHAPTAGGTRVRANSRPAILAGCII